MLHFNGAFQVSTRVYVAVSRGTDAVPRICARRVRIVQACRCTSTNKDGVDKRRMTSCLFDGIPVFLPSPRHLSSAPVYPFVPPSPIIARTPNTSATNHANYLTCRRRSLSK